MPLSSVGMQKKKINLKLNKKSGDSDQLTHLRISDCGHQGFFFQFD